MRWLPSIHIDRYGLVCLDDGEAEGPVITFEWLGLIAVFRRTRRIG